MNTGNPLHNLDIQDIYPMSDVEKGLIFHSLKNMESPLYFEQRSFQFSDPAFDPALFNRAFAAMVEKHPILRTGFNLDDFEEPLQIVHNGVPRQPMHTDLSHLDRQSQQEHIKTFLRQDRTTPFDLKGAEPLWRLNLFLMGGNRYLVIWSAHHAIIDGWSYASLMKEFNFTLDRMKTHPDFVPTPLKNTYKELVIQELAEKENPLSRKYWQTELEGYKRLKLYGTSNTPDIPGRGKYEINKGEEFLGLMKRTAGEFKTGLKYLCFAAYAYMLYMLSYEADVVIGISTNARPVCEDGDKIIGCFVNILPVRLDFSPPESSGAPSWRHFLRYIDGKALESTRYERFPFAEIVNIAGDTDADSKGQSDRYANPIFDTTFNFMDFPLFKAVEKDSPDSGGGKENISRQHGGATNILLDFGVEISGGRFVIRVFYETSVFSQPDIQRLCRYFETVLLKFARQPGEAALKHEIMSGEEKEELLHTFNSAYQNEDLPAFAAHATLHQAFQAAAKRYPHRVALVSGQDQFSYSYLDARADLLALRLREKGVGPGHIAAIMAEPSGYLITAILATLKAGAAYLPIDTNLPGNRTVFMLESSSASVILTTLSAAEIYPFTALRNIYVTQRKPVVTIPRPQVTDLDSLPLPDRSLIDYDRYSPYIGQAMVKNSYITLMATRGCPFKCAYCHKIWPKTHYVRSAQNIFEEVKLYYDMGVRRFVIVDDIFNFNIRNSSEFYRLLIKNRMKVELFFAGGLRGDILNKEYIDLMVEAGTVNVALALETASPRVQKLIGKNLNIEKFRENAHYFCQKYPHVILELFIMHGFPTETEEEAMMSYSFANELKWVHFPYINILRIFAGTDMEKLALENGVSMDAIIRSGNKAYHELPDTLPFDKSFTAKFQTDFLNEYLLSKERLLHVLPHQMKILTEDDIVQKYDSYLPNKIDCFDDILNCAGIDRKELASQEFLPEDHLLVPDINDKIKSVSTRKEPAKDAIRVLLLDLSQLFSSECHRLYDLYDPPLGILYLATYLNRELGGRVNVKTAKSRIDFDDYDGFKALLDDFKPDVIGIRTLTLYRDFFHKSVAMIRQWGVTAPVIAGGPYATSTYTTILQDANVDAAVIGEGEITLFELIQAMLNNDNTLPQDSVLETIKGLAYMPAQYRRNRQKFFPQCRELIMMDDPSIYSRKNHGQLRQPPDHASAKGSDPAYVIFTSGSTGTPKGVIVEHRNVMAYMRAFHAQFPITPDDIVLQQASFSFDVFVEEVYPTLLNGGRVAIATAEVMQDIHELASYIDKNQVNLVDCSPLLLNELNRPDIQALPSVHTFISGGDVLEGGYVDRLMENATVFNTYGPTESTVCATYHQCTPQTALPGQGVPIGKPISGYGVYILDSQLQMLPVGIPGELCVAGPGVARGYLNHPELTASRFVNHILKYKNYEQTSEPSPVTVYRTGDLARWLPDGAVQFLGRIDQQVKIRGFRIELGEIENRLRQIEGIADAVVMVTNNPGAVDSEDKYLCAYYSEGPNRYGKDSEKKHTGSDLKDRLAAHLPRYMIPSFFVRMSRFPLTSSGKLDRKKFPAPGISSGDTKFARPGTGIQKKLADIWAGVLDMDRELIGLDLDFFKAGGHSLKAIVLAGRIHNTFDVKLQLNEIFKVPTIRGLAQVIDKAATNDFISIQPAGEKEFYPLSSAQKRFYILYKMDESNTRYNIPLITKIEGAFDKDKFQAVFNGLIQRHENLRTAFVMKDDEPMQKVYPPLEISFEIEESFASETGMEDAIQSFIRPFDLSRAPVMRAGAIHAREDLHTFIIDMHHIMSDGVSHSVLIKDFIALYNGQPLTPLKLQYKDYSQWQHSHGEQEELKRQREYWMHMFSGPLPQLELPTDFPRPPVQSFEGSEFTFHFSGKNLENFRAMMDRRNVTLYMALLAVFYVLMSKLSGDEDIVIGIPVVGRNHPDLEQVIGVFTNTLALRRYPQAEISFEQFLKQIKQGVLESLRNQDYQFEDLVNAVLESRDPGRNPLFTVSFTLQNFELFPKTMPADMDFRVSLYGRKKKTAQFDLNLMAVDGGDAIRLVFEYCTALFQQESICRFAQCFNTIAAMAAERPQALLKDIDILSGEDRERLLNRFNDTAVASPHGAAAGVHVLFENQAQKNPQNIAVSHRGQTITYGELDERCNRLARFLAHRSKASSSSFVVAVAASPGIHTVTAILAILKAGAAYIPIDPAYPGERIRYMLSQGGVSLVLSAADGTPQALLDAAHDNSIDVYSLRDPDARFQAEIQNYPAGPMQSKNSASDLIYIIFTSGSTGKPKGAGVYHRNFLNLMHWFIDDFQLDDSHRLLLVTSLSFDLTQKNIYAPLLSGGTLYFPTSPFFEPGPVLDDIHEYGITLLNCTPGMFYGLAAEEDQFAKLACLRYLFLGGEPIAMKRLSAWIQSPHFNTQIVNTYGPTECADICASYRIPMEAGASSLPQSIPIGKPVYNVQLYILDRHQKLLPPGIPGELCIAGAGVGKGYINDPELTARRFVNFTSPATHHSSSFTIYKTGDLAKWQASGNILFLGRIDQQVKIRGFRIEPGEIENRLLKHPSVSEAAVIDRSDGSGASYLCAYIVSSGQTDLDFSRLRDFLADELPAYMLPSYFMTIDRIPLSPNGKIDRKTLPEPSAEAFREDSNQPATPPVTPVQRNLAAIWAELLGVPIDMIGIQYDFFNMGGDSLKAIMMISRIHKTFDINIPLMEVFKTPTISGLEQYISQASEEPFQSIQPVEDREYYPLSSAQKRVYFVQYKDKNHTGYNHPQAVVIRGDFSLEKMTGAFQTMVQRHEALRTSFEITGGEIVQRVHRDVGFSVLYREEPNGSTDHEYISRMLEEFRRPFDLSTAPLLRVEAVRIGAEKSNTYVLLLDSHHIITDGISIGILIAEFWTLYRGGEPRPLRLQYRDFSSWQDRFFNSGGIAKQEEYWLERFKGDLPRLQLPVDGHRQNNAGAAGKSVNFRIGQETRDRLQKMANRFDVTMFMLLLTVYNVLLLKYTGQEDIIVGTVTTGRNHHDLDPVIGMFVNTLAIRNFPAFDKTFSQFLEEVKQNTIDAYQNQDYQFDSLVNRIYSDRDMSRNPLFDTMMVWQNLVFEEVDSQHTRKFEITPHSSRQKIVKFDLKLDAFDADKGINFSFEYSKDLFNTAAIEQMSKHFLFIIGEVLQNPDLPIANIDLVNENKTASPVRGQSSTQAMEADFEL